MRVRIRVRGYGNGNLIFDQKLNVEDTDLDHVAAAQMERLLPYRDSNMVEIEFLDELDPKQRFFRFGTDPSRMVQPHAINLEKPS
jgi:hypothetical protein